MLALGFKLLKRINTSMVGIKLADGKFFPILSRDESVEKRLVLTTVKNNQPGAHIEICEFIEEEERQESIGFLSLDEIRPSPAGKPEIEFFLKNDESGTIDASAKHPDSGELTSFSKFLDKDGTEEDFNIEPALLSSEGIALIGGDTDLHSRRRGGSRPVLIISLILLLAVLGVVLVYYSPFSFGKRNAAVAAKDSDRSEQPEQAEVPAEKAAEVPAAVEKEIVPEKADRSGSPSADTRSAVPEAAGPESGTWHYIDWGDTLWDLSNSFYETPWLYRKIADENKISDPDRILAGEKIFIPETSE
jgi:hypothetical protein